MNSSIVILFLSQSLFTTSDVLARHNMGKHGFNIASFLSFWFLIYFLIKMTATIGQLYVFTNMQVGRTMTMFGMVSIVLSNLMGFLLLGESLTLSNYLGVSLAVLAFVVLGFKF